MSIDKAKEIRNQYDKIYRYCYFKLQKREIAEDITQETFLHFLESKDYHNEGKALQYLYTIARNLCIDEYRKKTYQSFEGGFDEKKSMGNSPRSGAVSSDMEERIITSMTVRAVLNDLEEEEREMVLLRYDLNISLPEFYISGRLTVYSFSFLSIVLPAYLHFYPLKDLYIP